MIPQKGEEHPLILSLQGKRIHLIGISGLEAASAARFLFSHGVKDLIGHDFSTKEDLQKNWMTSHLFSSDREKEETFNTTLRSLREVRLQDRYLTGIEPGDRVFVSQNWYNYPVNKPVLFDLQKKTRFLTLVGLYFDLAPCPILGVTGTKGKTTTMNLVLNILKHSGRGCYFSGNNRYIPQSLMDLDRMKPEDLLVMEISNRHLMDLHRSPHVGVITNIGEDHLIEHGGFGNYVEIKKRLIEHQKPGDVAVLNYANLVRKGLLSRVTGGLRSTPLFFSRSDRKLAHQAFFRGNRLVVRFKGKETVICKKDSIPIPGEHNQENVLASAAATFAAGVGTEAIGEGIARFEGIAERIERVREISGVTFYNDLSSTTPDSTQAALKTLRSNIILISGGDHKGSAFRSLIREIRKRVKRLLLLPGTVGEKFAPLLGTSGTDKSFVSRVDPCASLPEAIHKAFSASRPGDSVLLSPGAAYFHTKFIKGRPSFNSLVGRLKPK